MVPSAVGVCLLVVGVLAVLAYHQGKNKRGLFGQTLPPGVGPYTTLLMTGEWMMPPARNTI